MRKLIILLSFMIVASGAMAQQQKGDIQIQAQGSYFSNEFIDFGFLYFNASKFVTDNIEIGVSPQFSFSTVTTVTLSVFSNYSFLTADAKAVPYLGAGFSIYDLGSDTSTSGFTLKGGLRYFVTERVNIDFGPSVIFLSGSNLFVINAGLGYIFGKRG